MITCIKCKSKFEIPENRGVNSEELICPHCHSRFKVMWKMEVETPSEDISGKAAAGAVESIPAAKVKILVAVDGEATQDVMKEVLTGAGHEVFLASTGQEALSILEKEQPKVAYLDVALPQVLGFEVCEIIKKSQRLKSTIVILVSAIYDKTRYKRAPTSLYGADDYIERHHIQDGLMTKLNKLLNPVESTSSAPLIRSSGSSVEVMDRESLSPRHGVRETAVVKPEEKASIIPVQEVPGQTFSEAVVEPPVQSFTPEEPASSLSNPEIGSDLEVKEVQSLPPELPPVLSPEESVKHEEAKRFARLIISDIALYNQKAIEEGIENGNVEEILKDEMAEAEKLFRERVSKELREKTQYLQEALRDLVDRKTKMMKQGN